MSEWTQDQLTAAVEAYRWMQQRLAHGLSINKAQVYRELADRHGRTSKAWEYRMQNISHVLDQLQEPWLEGLRPAANVGSEVTDQLLELLVGTQPANALTDTSGSACIQLEHERRHAEESLAFAPTDAADQRRKTLAAIVRRQGQARFRSTLLEAYRGRCAITGCGVVDVLEAAHVYPYQGQATNAVTNGLLLRADVHTLFDLYLISVDPETRLVQASPTLRDSEYDRLEGSSLAQPRAAHQLVSTELLEWHRSQCEW